MRTAEDVWSAAQCCYTTMICPSLALLAQYTAESQHRNICLSHSSCSAVDIRRVRTSFENFDKSRRFQSNRGQSEQEDRRDPIVWGKYWENIMAMSQPMVKIRFEGNKLADCDFWTKSDPYLVISRPASRGAYDFKQVNYLERPTMSHWYIVE